MIIKPHWAFYRLSWDWVVHCRLLDFLQEKNNYQPVYSFWDLCASNGGHVSLPRKFDLSGSTFINHCCNNLVWNMVRNSHTPLFYFAYKYITDHPWRRRSPSPNIWWRVSRIQKESKKVDLEPANHYIEELERVAPITIVL